MNRLKKMQTVFFVTCFVSAAIFFSLVTAPGHFATTKVQGKSWRLKDIKVFNKLSSYSVITSESYDKNGGSVEINVSGNALNVCPGGSEKMRFTWRFGRDIAEVSNGDAVSANLQAGVVTYSKPCTGHHIAGLSTLYIYGSRGNGSPFSAEENRMTDGEKFGNLDDQYYVYASDLRQTSTSRVGVKDWPNSANYPRAWFEIQIGTRAGDILRYVYLYQLVGDGGGNSGGGGGGGSLTVENDTDRRGGDYKNFDLSQPRFELCRDACANDSNCRAYTYVKPGGQGPNARCWLKSSVPAAGASGCCISGVKR